MSTGTVTVTSNGETFEGHYVVADGMVHVIAAFGTDKKTQAGTAPVDVTAKMLLGQLARERSKMIAAGP